MDQARLKIQEILQNHKITLKNVPVAVHQPTPKENSSSPIKSRDSLSNSSSILQLIAILPIEIEITSLRERRKNEKKADGCNSDGESSPTKNQEKIQGFSKNLFCSLITICYKRVLWTGYETSRGMDQSKGACISTQQSLYTKNCHRKMKRLTLLSVKDLKKKMLGTQEELQKIKQQFQALESSKLVYDWVIYSYLG